MLLYWITLALGGTFLLASLLGGHDTDAHAEADHGHWGDAFGWLNLRAVVSAVAFFGLAGVLGHAAGLSGTRQFLLALVTGILVGAVTGKLIAYARKQEVATSVGNLVGRTGTVLVAPRDARPGKVRLNLAGQVSDVLASSNEPLTVGEHVIVIAASGGSVEVRRWDGLV